MTNKYLIANVLLLATMAFASFSCDRYDDTAFKQDISNLEDRVAALEAWQTQVNTDVTSLKTLVEALQNKRFITGLVAINGGYTIKFQTGSPITILSGVNGTDGEDGVNGTNGKDGASPKIGFKADGGVNYWTIDGEFILDDEGAKLPVTGANGEDGESGAAGVDAIAPQLRINSDTNEWEVSKDGGKTWTSTGVKATGAAGADGKSFFESIDATSPDKVTFTLTDGTTFTLPILGEVSLSFAIDDEKPINLVAQDLIVEIGVNINGLEEDDIKVMYAEIRAQEGVFSSYCTKALEHEIISIEPSSFTGKSGSAKLTIFLDELSGISRQSALLVVTVIDKSGKSYSTRRVLELWGSELEYLLSKTDGDFTYNATNDININSTLVVKEGKNYTLNLNGVYFVVNDIIIEDGASLTIDGGDGEEESSRGVVLLEDDTKNYGIHLLGKGSSLTINNAKISSYSNISTIAVGDEHNPEAIDNVVIINNSIIESNYDNALIVNNKQKISMMKSEIKSNKYGILQNGILLGSTLLLDFCEINAKNTAIFLSNTVDGSANDLTLTNSTITSKNASAIEVQKTNLTISNNTTLNSNAITQSYALNAYGPGSTGYGVVLAGYAMGKAYEGTVNIDASTTYHLSAGEGATNVLIYLGAGDGTGSDFSSME